MSTAHTPPARGTEQRDKPCLIFPRERPGPLSLRFPFKVCLKPFLNKMLSYPLDPPVMHTDPFGYHLIGIPLVGKK
jgi:hypothetical protein